MEMVAWWESLSTLERIFAYAAIPSTVLLLVQTILLMTGIVGQQDSDAEMYSDVSGLGSADGGDGMDVDTDFDGLADMPADATHGGHDGHNVYDPGLRILTIRGLIAFFSIGGWTGLVLLRGQAGTLLSSMVAVLAGLLAMVILAVLLKLSLKLQSDGSMDPRNALGAMGTVYLTVPATRNARGKITIMLQEQLRELDAVTDSNIALKTGEIVRVVDVINNDTLVVVKAVKSPPGSEHTSTAHEKPLEA